MKRSLRNTLLATATVAAFGVSGLGLAQDSALKTRLYRHLQKEENERLGFFNSIILTHAYVLGATRNPRLDAIVGGLFALTLLGILVHAAGRVLGWFLRRRRKDE